MAEKYILTLEDWLLHPPWSLDASMEDARRRVYLILSGKIPVEDALIVRAGCSDTYHCFVISSVRKILNGDRELKRIAAGVRLKNRMEALRSLIFQR